MVPRLLDSLDSFFQIMKESPEDKNKPVLKKEKKDLKGAFERFKNGPHKCVFCAETFNGIKAMLSHLKDHCR